MPFNFNNSTERITSLNGDINIAYLLGISNDRKPKYLSVTAIKNWITPQIDVKILGYIQNDDITEGDTNNQRDAVAPSVRASAEYSRRKATQAKNEVTGDTNNNWYNGDRTLWGLNNKLEALDYQNNARINGELLTRAIDIFSIYTDDPGIADLEPLLDPITASDPDNPILEMGTITLNKLYRILTEGGFQLHVQFNRDKDVSGNDPQYDERVNNKQFIFRFPISVIHRNGKATRVFLYLQVLGEVVNDSLMEYTIQWDGLDNKYCLMCSVEDPSEVNVVGDDTDDWDNQKTLYGLKKNLDDSISAEETARQNADIALRGTDDDPTSITIRGARALAQQLTTQAIEDVLGTSDRDYDGNPNLSPTAWENRYGSISGIVPVTSNSLVVGNDNVAVKSELLLNAIRAGKLSDGGTRLTIGFDINNGIISALNGKSYKVEDLEKASGWIMQIAIQSEDTTNTPATNWYYIYVLVVTPLGTGVIQQSTTILSANHVKFIELTNNDYNVKGDLWDRLMSEINQKVENTNISSSTDGKTGVAPSYPKVRNYADGKVSNAAITDNTALQETVAPSYKQVKQYVDTEVGLQVGQEVTDRQTADNNLRSELLASLNPLSYTFPNTYLNHNNDYSYTYKTDALHGGFAKNDKLIQRTDYHLVGVTPSLITGLLNGNMQFSNSANDGELNNDVKLLVFYGISTSGSSPMVSSNIVSIRLGYSSTENGNFEGWFYMLAFVEIIMNSYLSGMLHELPFGINYGTQSSSSYYARYMKLRIKSILATSIQF